MQPEFKHQDIYDFLEEGIIHCDAEGQITQSNKAAQLLLGISLTNIPSIDSLIEHLGPGSEALNELNAGDSSMLVVGGSLIEARKQVMSQSSVIILTDRSEELRWQSQLAEQGHMLASNTEAYMVIDSRGLVRYANNFCERERGYDVGGMVGLLLKDVEIGRDKDGVSSREYSQEEVEQRLEEVLRNNEPVRYESWHVRSDGSIFPTSVSLRPYRMTSEVVLLLTVHDETERYRQLQALMEARAEAESSNNAKSAFMAVTSHELRTPLTTVIGFIELLQLDYGEGHGDISRYLSLMHKSSRSLLRLIEDILDFTRIESKTVSLEIRSIDVDAFLKSTVERWQLRFDKEEIDFNYKVVGDISGMIQSDPDRMNQLLDNLIGNALKFTEQGSVTLEVEKQDELFCFRVIDTGCGIEEAQLSKIFDPFYQVDDAMTRSSDGTGLGLYICRNLSKILGGSINVSSRSKKGSCFELRFPITIPQV